MMLYIFRYSHSAGYFEKFSVHLFLVLFECVLFIVVCSSRTRWTFRWSP